MDSICSGVNFELNQTVLIRLAHPARRIGTELHTDIRDRFYCFRVHDEHQISAGVCGIVSCLRTILGCVRLGRIFGRLGLLCPLRLGLFCSLRLRSLLLGLFRRLLAGVVRTAAPPARIDTLRTAANRIEMYFFIVIVSLFEMV